LGHRRVILLFAFVEAGIFQHQHLARLQLGNCGFSGRPRGRIDKLHRYTNQRCQMVGCDLHAVFGVGAALRAAQVAHQNDRRPLFQQIVDRRQGGLNAGIIGHMAVTQRHIKIDPH
jgi:hypothetical protein